MEPAEHSAAAAVDVDGATYRVIVHEAEEGGFWVEADGLPGCVSQGETKEETLENVKDAIQGWLEVWEEIEQERARGV